MSIRGLIRFLKKKRGKAHNLNSKDLEVVFRSIGADNPDEWASSEVREDIPQLGRYLFLRGCWSQVIDPRNDAWIDAEIRQAKTSPDLPEARVGEALTRMLALGVPRQDITELVRGMQKELICKICYLLDDPLPAIERLPLEAREALKDFGWSLFEINANGSIGRPISGLHESVLETDPRGAA